MALSNKQKTEIKRLFNEGKGRNQIAMELNIGGRQVSEACQEMGLKFDTKQMEAATRARETYAAERRSLLMQTELDHAQKLQSQMFAPAKQGQFGGRDNTWNEVALEEPNFADKLRLQQAINGCVNNILRLIEADAGSNRTTINLVIATAEKLGLADSDGE